MLRERVSLEIHEAAIKMPSNVIVLLGKKRICSNLLFLLKPATIFSASVRLNELYFY